MIIITNAPGRSAFNRVKRRMTHLSRELSGLILPHDHFGNHLNSFGKTINSDLEFQNFKHAGKVLAEVCSSIEIDNYPVVAEFSDVDCVFPLPDMESPEWYSSHVRESNYFLQVCNL